MTDEARRLLEDVVNAGPSRLKAVMYEIESFLASPEPAAREAVLTDALTGLMKDMHTGSSIVHRGSLGPNDTGCARPCSTCDKARDALADTSPAAAALLAQGERLERLAKSYARLLDAYKWMNRRDKEEIVHEAELLLTDLKWNTAPIVRAALAPREASSG